MSNRYVGAGRWRALLIVPIILMCGGDVAWAATDEAIYRYNEEGLAKVKNNDYDGAITAFKAALLRDPYSKIVRQNLAIAYNNYGFALRAKGENARAVEKFEAALIYDPENPYILYNIGQTYYQMQHMSKAATYLDRAARLKSDIKGANELATRVSEEADAESAYQKIETMHFTIAVSAGVSITDTAYSRAQLEEAYGRIGIFLDQYPKRKVTVLLYGEDDYDGMLGGRPHWAVAFFDGKVRIPVTKFRYSSEEVTKIIYHEYAHALIWEMAGDRCPLWLNEGIAANAEDLVIRRDTRPFKECIINAGIVSLRNIPPDISRFGPELAFAVYAESYLAVEFMVKRYGHTAMRLFLRQLGEGKSIDEAALAAFGDTFDRFEERFREHVRNEYGVAAVR